MSDNKPYIVSARKYRPATFKTVVGQRALTATLKNAIDTKRLAQAYLFCGPRGVGKTSCARIFAKTINCLTPTPDGEACGLCESCRAIELGNSFNLVELDAASNNSVDDIRSITEQVNVPPQNGRYRVFIIDEVHMLSNAAFNAFLKTLEEPPKNVVFILATTEKHKVIPTILSRCQIYDFKRITVNDMIDHLEYVAKEEGVTAERDALGVIALKADGAMRDALSIFDQVAASSRGNVTYRNTIDNLNVLDHDYYFRLVEAFRNGDVPESLLIYKEIRDKGFDSLFLVNGLAAHLRDLMVAADSRTLPLLETSEEIAGKYTEQAKTLPAQWYYAAIKLLSDCDLNYRTASSKRLLVELTFIRLCQLLKPATPPFDSTDRQIPLGDPTQSSSARSATAAAAPAVPATPASGQTQPQHQPIHSQTSQPLPPQSAPQNAEPAPAKTASPASVTPPPAKTSPRQPRATGRPSSFRLKEASNTTVRAENTLQQRTTPIDHSRFMAAWNEFIVRNPSLHILVNTMRAAQPQQTAPNAYTIIVDHPAQLQAFELSMPRLIEYLRDYLANDLLTLKVEVTEAPVDARQLPPRDFLKQVVETNPAIAKVLQEINGELI
ncbi:MAG: DNA polymerase III subunit gamma/tau [Muribaculaceae bacterium]|nr:DNA polymerase III subunit gamma/tau [Muribaculaceae bacterium]